MGAARLAREPEGVGVHEADHQHVVRVGVLDHRRDESVPIETQRDRRVFGGGHGRTGMLWAARYAFASATRYSPKWKIEAASTASARPGASASTRWSRLPAPPEAMTGMVTLCPIASRSSRSYPSLV